MPTCSHCSTPCLDGTTLCTTCSTALELARASPPLATPAPGGLQETSPDTEGLHRPTNPSEEPRFEPGTILADRYRIANVLGRGGMGEVYRADDLELGDVVALKFLPGELEHDRRRLAMLLSETRIARTVSHQHVCRVHDLGIHRGEHAGELHFVSMEYIDGEDLASLLRRIGRLPRDKALEVSRQLCAGLAAVHACGLLHRDIKPSNVMLDGQGQVRLTDFGLAIVDSEAAGLGGTPAYMAPEQHTKQGTTVRSDVYSLGLVLYEIFTGERAFTAKSPREYAWRHLQYQPETPSSHVEDLHPGIERVILACLEKVPEHRMASAEAVAEALAQDDDEGSGTVDHSIGQGDVLRALLLCDLVGSTALVERLGDQRAAELGARHDRLARDLLLRHLGREIDKTDGFLLLFERPIQALRFALDYHEALERLSLEEGCELESRVGIHFGGVWLRENLPADVRRGAKPIEVEGLAKAVAARLMSLAEGRQTLLSQGAFDLARRAAVGLEEAKDLRWLDHGAWRLHGVADPVDIYEVGREGQAPLEAPSESEKVRRLLMQPRVAGWRPAPGLSVPGRPYWQVKERLGVGGFGEAWLVQHDKTGEPRCFKFCFDAERLRGLQREITLFRLLKEELGERQDINRLLDWNLDEAPYFIESEYTSAGDLVRWAESEGGLARVPLATRLEIVAQVATALAAAHSVGVLHKDVKPSNILIHKTSDGRLQAQLADFGVGQATEQERLAAAGITVLGLSRRNQGDTSSSQTGTQLYMAPELLEGHAPTLQADIYALGVLLYQIVVGDFGRALAQGWKREFEDELLTGDIASFVDGSPERRPSSAQEVAQRLRGLEERRQEHQAAEASRRAHETSRRRRTVYKTVAATALVALVAVSVLAIWALRAGREERRARETTERVLDFMISVFEITDPYSEGDPGEKRGQNITAREILDRGAERIDVELTDEPLVQARLMDAYGSIYRSLGLYERAQSLYERALALRRDWLGAEHPDTLLTMKGLAKVLHARGEYAQSKKLLEQTLQVSKRVLGAEHPDTLKTMKGLASSLSTLGEHAEAKGFKEQVLEIQNKVLGAEHPDTLKTMGELATYPMVLSNFAAAKRLLEPVLEVQTQVLGAEHLDTLMTMEGLAISLSMLDEHAEAKRLLGKVVEIQTRVLGAEHPNTLRMMYSLTISLSMLGEYAESKRLHEEILEIQTRVLGARHPDTLMTLSSLANSLSMLGEYAESKRLREEILEIQTRVLGAEHPHSLMTLSSLANSLSRLGEITEAKRLREEILEIQTRVLGAEHPHSLWTMNDLAGSLSGLGEITEAKRLREEILEIQTRVLGAEHPDTLRTLSSLASSLSDLGEYAEAKRLREGILEIQTRVLGAEHPDTLRTLSSLASSRSDLGEYAEAKQLREEILEIQTRVLGPEHRNTLSTIGRLASSLSDLGEYSQALELFEECLKLKKRVYGVDHPSTLYSMNAMAMTLSRQGKLDEAEELQQEVLATATKTVGNKHRLSLSSMKNLGEIVSLRGDWSRARRLQEETLEAYERVYTPDHQITLEVKIELTGTLWKLGELERAKELAQAAVERLEAKLGSRHVLTNRAGKRLLEIAMHENDSEAALLWTEKLRWLSETDEQDIDSAKQREIRRYVLEVLPELKVASDDHQN